MIVNTQNKKRGSPKKLQEIRKGINKVLIPIPTILKNNFFYLYFQNIFPVYTSVK